MRLPARSLRSLAATAAVVVAAGATYACSDGTTNPTGGDGVGRRYGPAVSLGNGHVRTYVLLDERNGGAPTEIGVAFDSAALQGLPAPMQMPPSTDDNPHAHLDFHEYDLELPAQHGTPYNFVELDWNPGGHEPAGIYEVPHFDFHFYTISLAARNRIDPAVVGGDAFAAMSAHLPAADQTPQYYVPLSAPGTPPEAVPHMGVHWPDVRSPELQGMLGNPAGYRPFLTTFLHGSWDGQFIFDEPMVTRAFILGRKSGATAAERDSVIALPQPAHAQPAGLYPASYHVTWDASSKEFHVALSKLTPRS